MSGSDSRPVLRLGHSPDPDDAFMWWPILPLGERQPPLDTGRFRFEAVAEDIEALNFRAEAGDLEITAMSCAQYPRVQRTYAITACGASMGEGYGPKLVARTRMTLDELRRDKITIAVPGRRTSAFGALSLLLGAGKFVHEVVGFFRIIDKVREGVYQAGVVIHEGQLTYEDAGLFLIEDLGRWWGETRNLPLPLGINTIRRDLDELHGPGTLEEVTAILRQSVEYALAHREEAIGFALEYGRGIDPALADEFVRMYVNHRTLDFGDQGREAVRRFLAELAEAGVAPPADRMTFVQGVQGQVETGTES